MYEEGKEPRVRFEVDVTLTEILAVRDGSSKLCELDSGEAVALAAALKTLRGLAHKQWPSQLVVRLMTRALMARAPYMDHATAGLAPEDDYDGRFEDWLHHFQPLAFKIAMRAVDEMDHAGWD